MFGDVWYRTAAFVPGDRFGSRERMQYNEEIRYGHI